jgi:DNA polymerase III sliding clamp (beta) subunit (PCNA family)
MLLHRNLGAVAALTEEDVARYSLGGVLIERFGEGYRAVATNGRALIVVESPSEPTELPAYGLEFVGDQPRAIIPGEHFASMFAPRGEGVAVDMKSGAVSMVSAEKGGIVRRDVKTLDGRFPDYATVVPKDAPKFTCEVNPIRFLDMLKCLSELQGDDEYERVTIEFREPETPLVFRGKTSHGQTLIGMVMPLSKSKEAAP